MGIHSLCRAVIIHCMAHSPQTCLQTLVVNVCISSFPTRACNLNTHFGICLLLWQCLSCKWPNTCGVGQAIRAADGFPLPCADALRHVNGAAHCGQIHRLHQWDKAPGWPLSAVLPLLSRANSGIDICIPFLGLHHQRMQLNPL
jgi:hypothetical protein